MIIKFCQTDPKKINDEVFLRNSVNVFSEGRRQEKFTYSAHVYRFKTIYFYLDGRQQDESTCHWHDPPGGAWGDGSLPNVSTPFFPGREKKKGKFHKKVSSIWLKIAMRVAYG